MEHAHFNGTNPEEQKPGRVHVTVDGVSEAAAHVTARTQLAASEETQRLRQCLVRDDWTLTPPTCTY